MMRLQAVQPRIHPARQNVGQGISGENEQGGKQRNTQQQGCIAARAGFHGGLSKSGIGKYGFGQNRSAKQFTRVGKMQGQCRQCAVAQSVAPCAAPAAKTLRLCQQCIVACHHLAHLVAGVQCDLGNAQHRQGKHGQCQVVQAL